MTTTTMMTEAPARPLTRDARHLIDARLDTIDRMLVGRLPRADRIAIARDVELQIHDLLQERDTENELGRDDVLEVLARLDPPEAFLPEESLEISGSLPVRLAAVGATPRSTPTHAGVAPKPTWHAKASGVLGIISLVLVFLVPIAYMLAMIAGSELLLWGGAVATIIPAFITGLLALIFGLIARPKTGWAIAGSITGGLAMLGSMVLGAYLILILLASSR